MISIREVFLKEQINSIDDITEQERMNLNAYLLDHFSLGFKDVYSEPFNTVLQNAIMRSVKSIDIPLQMVKIINKDKESFKDAVIFQ
jgi:hypothetical protein